MFRWYCIVHLFVLTDFLIFFQQLGTSRLAQGFEEAAEWLEEMNEDNTGVNEERLFDEEALNEKQFAGIMSTGCSIQ